MALAQGSIEETVRTLCYNHKHVCAGNLDYCIRVTVLLADLLTCVFVVDHFDLE